MLENLGILHSHLGQLRVSNALADLVDVVAPPDNLLRGVVSIQSGPVHRPEQVVEVEKSDMVDEALGLYGLVVVGMQRFSHHAVLHIVETVLDLPALLVCHVDLLRIAFEVANEGEDGRR